MSKVPFIVTEVTSQDPNFPGCNLERSNSVSWRSTPNCSYPQAVVLKVPSNSPAILDKITFLSHEFMIPQRIEIFVASANRGGDLCKHDFDSLGVIQRLGFIMFDSNEKSEYRARELKTVQIDSIKVSAIKLVISSCLQNSKNCFNQVELSEISLIGKIPPGINNSKFHNHLDLIPLKISEAGTSPKQRTLSKAEKEIETKLMIMENEKKRRAAIEDYEGAALIKKALINAQSSFDLLHEMNGFMLQAAAEEDYEEAHRLKVKRDSAREATMYAFVDATESVGFSFPDDSMTFQSNNNKEISFESTINAVSTFVLEEIQGGSTNDNDFARYSNVDQTDATKIIEQTASANEALSSNNFDNRTASIQADEYLPGARSPNSLYDVSKSVQECTDIIKFDESHPLLGVPGFEALPDPGDVIVKSEHNVLSKRIEDILGSYIMKCLFSRNWALREAALTKTSLIITELKETHGIVKVASVLCEILERSLNDRIVQVFLTSLILLDDCLVEFEEANMPSRKAISLMENIIKCLMGKLAENKPKIVDGAETTLLSFALSSCIGPSHIGKLSMNELSTQEKKSGRGVCNRLRFIQKLIDEFGDEALTGKQVFDFIKDVANAFSHKDSEVREAGKDLILVIGQVSMRPEQVIDLLGTVGLSDRQMREYQVAFDNLQYASVHH